MKVSGGLFGVCFDCFTVVCLNGLIISATERWKVDADTSVAISLCVLLIKKT